MKTSLFDTSFFLPDWWLQFFNKTFSFDKNKHDLDRFVAETKFLPFLTPLQLKLVSQVVGSMQKQLLFAPSDTLKVSLGTISKELQLSAKRQKQQAERLLHDLWSLRLLQGNEQKMHACPIFQAETWHHTADGLSSELKLSPWGSELLLGYCEPYADFLRQINGEIQLRQICPAPPLHLWKSVWLDVQGTEQVIYLHIEETVQRQGNWLNLEHSTCQSLTQLISRAGSEEKKFVRTISALGKKLLEHGYLVRTPSPSSIFLDAEQKKQTQLVWTVQGVTEVKKRQDSYVQSVCSYFCAQHLKDTLSNLLAALVPEQRSVHRQLWAEFSALLTKSDFSNNTRPVVMLTPGSPLLDTALFFEWNLRQLIPALPLPSELISSELADSIDPKSSLPLQQRFIAFRNYVEQNPQLAEDLCTIPLACLVNSQNSKPLKEYLQGRFGSEIAPRKTTTPAATASSTSRTQLQRIAALELKKIISRSRVEYQELEGNYLDSLSSEAKESILEVKKHMQANLFETHLRPRLISFMVDNPSLWEKTKAVQDLHLFD